MNRSVFDCRVVLDSDEGVQPDVLRQVIDVFERHQQFRPDAFALEDFPKARKPYVQEGFLNNAIQGDRVAALIQLFRERTPQYDALIDTVKAYGTRLIINFQQVPAEELPHVYDFAEQLAGIVQPDYGGVIHYWDEDHDEAESFNESLIAKPNHVRKNGPDRLGVRTWLGPRIAALIHEHGTTDLPGAIVKRPWGGLQIDLLPEPWSQPFEDLYAAQERAMLVLGRSGVFGNYEKFPLIRPGRNWQSY